MNPKMRTAAALLTVLLCFLLLAGCDGGGSPTEPRTGVFFTPDRSAGSNSVTLRAVGVASNTLALEIFATEVSDLHSMVVTVVYPNNLLRFDGYREGDFLGLSVPLTVSFFDNVVITQLRVLPSGVSGSGTIGTLSFTAVAEGSDRVGFVDPLAQDPMGMELADVDWIGGRVEVAF